MEKMYLEPAEIAKKYSEVGRQKTHCPAYKLILLGILAGAFIALAAQGSNVAIHTIVSVGLGKALAGAIFATGLMMVIITGAELFTGNTLIVISCLEKKSCWQKMLQNWFYVYLGNFIGSIFIVLLILNSGQFSYSGGLLGGFTIKVAAYKTGLSFEKAFFMGILCNILVCLAVWMAAAAQDITGKLLAIFFPIWLFITSGFEHSIANMYYIPAGILAKLQPGLVEQSIALGVTGGQLSQLTWAGFFSNLLPVTLGNIVGGSLFVGLTYWICYLFQVKSIPSHQINNNYEQSGGKKHAVQK